MIYYIVWKFNYKSDCLDCILKPKVYLFTCGMVHWPLEPGPLAVVGLSHSWHFGDNGVGRICIWTLYGKAGTATGARPGLMTVQRVK
jgi:hypothetical protein